ncbi:MAG: hypothetical protein AB7K24_25050 [Gemmataceae bacterium]
MMEAPGVQDRSLRRINAMLNLDECRERAFLEITARADVEKDDPGVACVLARAGWIARDVNGAESILRRSLAAHPDKGSLNSLLGEITWSRGNPAEAARRFQAALKAQPTDLFAYISLQLIEFQLTQSEADAEDLLAIASVQTLPGGLRERVAATVAREHSVDPDYRERAYQEQLSFDSATPRWMKQINYARFLITVAGKIDQGRMQLYSVDPAVQESNRDWQEVTAISYLMEARSLDAVPTPRNKVLIEKAMSVLHGDPSGLKASLAGGALWETLAPLVPSTFDPDIVDRYGRNQLCNAAMTRNAGMALEAIAAGTDVNSPNCDGTTALAAVLRGTRFPPDALDIDMLKILLANEAEPDPILFSGTTERFREWCASERGCMEALGALFDDYWKEIER